MGSKTYDDIYNKTEEDPEYSQDSSSIYSDFSNESIESNDSNESGESNGSDFSNDTNKPNGSNYLKNRCEIKSKNDIITNRFSAFVEELVETRIRDKTDTYPMKHIACIFSGTSSNNFSMSGVRRTVGTNSSRSVRSGCEYSRHAEVDAMLKLPPPGKRRRKNNKKSLDIVIIRVNKSGVVRRSDPCFMCIKHMLNLKYYRIRYVYFSNDDGDIERHTLKQLSQIPDDEKHVSHRFKKFSSNHRNNKFMAQPHR